MINREPLTLETVPLSEKGPFVLPKESGECELTGEIVVDRDNCKNWSPVTRLVTFTTESISNED